MNCEFKWVVASLIILLRLKINSLNSDTIQFYKKYVLIHLEHKYFLQIIIPQEAGIYDISYDIDDNGNLVITAPQANGEHLMILAST